MMLKMYCMYDVKTQVYSPPAFCHNAGHATRVFTSVAEDRRNIWGQYPADFQVWEIGTFDDQTSKVCSQQPFLVCSLADLVRGGDIVAVPEVKHESELAKGTRSSDVDSENFRDYR